MMADAMTEKSKKSSAKKKRQQRGPAEKGPRQQRGPAKKGPARADPQSLIRAAYWYLERFATSAENLRRVLMRRVEKAARAYDLDRAAGAADIDAIIRRLIRDGLLDDGAYAQARVRSMRAAGKPARAIEWALAGKGVGEETIDQAIAAIDKENAGEGQEADFRAALHFAKRRRLGPYRDAAQRQERKQKDMAALARAGFSYGVAERIIKAESLEAPEEEEDI
jgi:regulatory protein